MANPNPNSFVLNGISMQSFNDGSTRVQVGDLVFGTGSTNPSIDVHINNNGQEGVSSRSIQIRQYVTSHQTQTQNDDFARIFQRASQIVTQCSSGTESKRPLSPVQPVTKKAKKVEKIEKVKEEPRCSVTGCTNHPAPPSSHFCTKCQKECITTVDDPRIKITDLGNGRKHAYFGYQIWVKDDEDGEALQDLMDSCHRGGYKVQEPYGMCSDRGFNFKMTGWNV